MNRTVSESESSLDGPYRGPLHARCVARCALRQRAILFDGSLRVVSPENGAWLLCSAFSLRRAGGLPETGALSQRLAATIGAASMPGLLAVGDTPPSVDARSVVVQAGRSSISSLGTSRPLLSAPSGTSRSAISASRLPSFRRAASSFRISSDPPAAGGLGRVSFKCDPRSCSNAEASIC
jgi:hypothetical protein